MGPQKVKRCDINLKATFQIVMGSSWTQEKPINGPTILDFEFEFVWFHYLQINLQTDGLM